MWTSIHTINTMTNEINSTKQTESLKKERESTARNKQALLKAFLSTTGNISYLCQSVGISRYTYYDWLKNDPEFKAKIEAEREGLIDFAEAKLFQLIDSKNITAIIFFLKCKGKGRGYLERQEIEHSGGLDNKLTVEVVHVGSKGEADKPSDEDNSK